MTNFCLTIIVGFKVIQHWVFFLLFERAQLPITDNSSKLKKCSPNTKYYTWIKLLSIPFFLPPQCWLPQRKFEYFVWELIPSLWVEVGCRVRQASVYPKPARMYPTIWKYTKHLRSEGGTSNYWRETGYYFWWIATLVISIFCQSLPWNLLSLH